jgi:phosphoenolpyruvate-protein phosphotransferase/dihydroxyacetone kinase phosphotransfer subunit
LDIIVNQGVAMVGIVIVSHSAKLAEGVYELADQMVQGKVPMAIAGGIDDPENPIGTDAMKVMEAIQSVYSDDGVVVLMDLGSALLSTELALELLEPEVSKHVYLTAAPLVEGVMAAAVQASIGGTPLQVIEEARGALSMKAGQLGEANLIDVSPAMEAAPVAEEAHELILTIPNKLGLHARPAALFVAKAAEFQSDIYVFKADKQANAKSINQVAMLGARQGDEIRIVATGEDASDALNAIQELANNNFGDRDDTEKSPPSLPSVAAADVDSILTGIAASPGIAIGPAALYKPSLPKVDKYHIEDTDEEWARLKKAMGEAVHEIEQILKQAVRQVGKSEAAIFEAHSLMLQDPELYQSVRELLVAEEINAEAAWLETITKTADGYRALDSAYMQARAADVEDIGQRVLRKLMALEPPALDFTEPSILIAADLSPSDTARLDPAKVLGICTELGGATSHSAILARGLGIPALVGLGTSVWAIEEEQLIAIDGTAGLLWLKPSESELKDLRDQQDTWQEEQEIARQESKKPAVTLDGQSIEIAANIGGPNDVPIALDFGAEGVGLFRTEFLFLDRATAPTEEEQYKAYRQAADALGELPLIIRTLDVGGDKPLPYLDLGEEENPFLGWRGIRFCLDNPEIFKPQLRAILRAGADHNVKMMFPMIGTIDEIHMAKGILSEVKIDLARDQTPFNKNMDVGIMIEVPSAVAIADIFASEVDFFSIGTNDLTQYTMAADRGNSKVSDLAQALNPAVLRLISQTVTSGHAAGIWVGMCGELAGNPNATALLVGLGLDELSMSAPSIPVVKEAIRNITREEARQLAETVMNLDSALAVSEYLASSTT